MPTAADLNDALVSFVAFARKRRLVTTASPDSLVKVNIGSGLCVADGWINLDVNIPTLVARWPSVVKRMVYRIMPRSSAARRFYSEEQFCEILNQHVFVHHDITYGVPFRDQSVDYIYSSHFVEHLFLGQARSLFRDCHRVLKSGGVFRVVVPDLEYVLSLFNHGEQQRALSYFFYDSGPSYFTRHKYMYDFGLMKKELAEAGFNSITRYQCGRGATPDIEALDRRDEESLYVEAVRP